MRDFANCRTKGLVYLCSCSCPLDYIGKTVCQFRRRILDHIGDTRSRRETPIARHVWDVHGGDEKVLRFYVIEVIRNSPRRGDLDKHILQKETRWIHHMR